MLLSAVCLVLWSVKRSDARRPAPWRPLANHCSSADGRTNADPDEGFELNQQLA
jgi:hypothetical protein